MDTYDALPYDTKPGQATHPDRLAALARLHGIPAAPVETSRVIELGCGTGANLIPMAAALPHAHFVGIDRSAVQIGLGQRWVEALGLDNLELRVGDLRDPHEGPYDTVIAHGLYSWVPPEVREVLMERIAALLAPTGVALVSWNALPGWRVRGTLRDLLRQHVHEWESLHDRVAAARTLLARLAEAPVVDPLALQLRDRARALATASDTYLLHDYLADVNDPVYLRDFRAHAERNGLRLVCEAELGADAPPPGLEPVLELLSDGPQGVDFLVGRAFRRSVLCHADQGGPAEPEALAALFLHTPLVPEPSDVGFAFTLHGRPALATENPLLGAALIELAARAPASVGFDALCEAAWARAGHTGPASREARTTLIRTLFQCAEHRFVELLARSPGTTGILGARPEAWSVARAFAASGAPWVPSLLHRAVAVDALDASLIELLDGTRSKDALLADLGARHPSLGESSRNESALLTEVPRRLAQLVRAGLFVDSA